MSNIALNSLFAFLLFLLADLLTKSQNLSIRSLTIKEDKPSSTVQHTAYLILHSIFLIFQLVNGGKHPHC